MENHLLYLVVLCRDSRVAGGVVSDCCFFISFLLIFLNDIHIRRGGVGVGKRVDDSPVVFRGKGT